MSGDINELFVKGSLESQVVKNLPILIIFCVRCQVFVACSVIGVILIFSNEIKLFKVSKIVTSCRDFIKKWFFIVVDGKESVQYTLLPIFEVQRDPLNSFLEGWH